MSSSDEKITAVIPLLPADLFPGGAKAGWWAKGVQLDQEAKGNLIREKSKPLRWYRAGLIAGGRPTTDD